MVDTGYIIYADESGDKKYIQRHIDIFKKEGVELKFVTLDKLNSMPTPKFAVMRAIAPAITRELEEKGVRVFNNSLTSTICNNKAKTYEYVGRAGVEYLPFYKSVDEALKAEFPLVAKSLDGHGGKEVFMIKNSRELEEKRFFFEKNYIFQKTASEPGKDMRVYVLGETPVAAMLRSSKTDFRSNFCLGGSAKRVEIPPDVNKKIKDIKKILPFDYVGIDFIFHEGKPVFNEIEDVVGSRMLYTHTDIDIVKDYVYYILKVLNMLKV